MACAATTSASTSTRCEGLALSTSPKLIIAGGSAYARFWDFAALPRDRRRGRRLSHGRHGPFRRAGRRRRPSLAVPARPCRHHDHAQNPARPARRPDPHQRRGLAKKINSAIFPGLQGGPLMHVIAAKAVAFGEALQPRLQDLREAGRRQRQGAGRDAACGRARPRLRRHRQPPDAGRSAAQERLTGKAAETALGRAGITCNKNGIPFDPEKPFDHLGHPARHAGGDHARLRSGRIQAGRRADRRGARRPGEERRGRQCGWSRRR